MDVVWNGLVSTFTRFEYSGPLSRPQVRDMGSTCDVKRKPSRGGVGREGSCLSWTDSLVNQLRTRDPKQVETHVQNKKVQ